MCPLPHETSREVEVMVEETRTEGGRSLRCRFGMHRFQTTTNDGGEAYLVCERCGKEEFPSWSIARGVIM
jgi:hypothetical protein